MALLAFGSVGFGSVGFGSVGFGPVGFGPVGFWLSRVLALSVLLIMGFCSVGCWLSDLLAVGFAFDHYSSHEDGIAGGVSLGA